MNKIGCCYHPKLADERGRRVAEELIAAAAGSVDETWIAPAWDEEAMRRHVPGTDLLLCVGGDGTILRAARAVVLHQTLLLPLERLDSQPGRLPLEVSVFDNRSPGPPN